MQDRAGVTHVLKVNASVFLEDSWRIPGGAEYVTTPSGALELQDVGEDMGLDSLFQSPCGSKIISTLSDQPRGCVPQAAPPLD
ncbi:unnamed protein product [Lota lota]